MLVRGPYPSVSPTSYGKLNTERAFGLLPNMGESSGTPGENRARGSLASVFP